MISYLFVLAVGFYPVCSITINMPAKISHKPAAADAETEQPAVKQHRDTFKRRIQPVVDKLVPHAGQNAQFIKESNRMSGSVHLGSE